MQNNSEFDQIKDEMLALMNEMRTHLGQEPLKVFPERSCAFCGKSEEEAGTLFRGDIFEFIHICRVCTGKAQRSFITGLTGGNESKHET